MRGLAMIVAVSMVGPRVVVAQHQHGGYAANQAREIKALSAEETSALLTGEGFGMALPAEMNGYPGPRHVLDFGDSLALTPDQHRRVQAIFDSMQARAQDLGRRIVELERRLDRVFAAGGARADSVEALTAEIGRDRGQLRAVHLVAHLETAAVLDPGQRERYQVLRGYDPGGH